MLGGGKTQSQARKILYIPTSEGKIAVINVCEHEFSIAAESYGGSNPIDLIDTVNDIRKARENADFVIVITHGGIEHYQLPTPRMKKWYRHFVDMGADAVVNHHQHCFSGYEDYNGKPIFYGLGNFQFDSYDQKKNTPWNYGYAVNLCIADRKICFDVLPYNQCSETPAIKLRNIDEFENEITFVNEIISDNYLLENKMNNHVLEKESSIYGDLMPFNTNFVNRLIKKLFLRSFYTDKKTFVVCNRFYCESHLESLKQLFMIKTK